MEPLQVLFETERHHPLGLPAKLEELYGGSLGFGEPCLYANFVSTIDGVVAIPSVPRSNALIAAGSRADRFVMGLLRALADVVLIGAGTLAGSPRGTWQPGPIYPPAANEFADLRRRLGKPERASVAILTGHGSISPAHPVLETGALVLTSQPGAARLEGRLPAASAIAVLGPEPMLDPHRIVDALLERESGLILSEAGPHTFGELLAAKLVDELFLTVSPLLAGDPGDLSRYGLVESVDLVPGDVRAELLGVRRHEQHLFLRYAFEGGLTRKSGVS
jgi:riboflavin biosynthesis pyrimidine reductase